MEKYEVEVYKDVIFSQYRVRLWRNQSTVWQDCCRRTKQDALDTAMDLGIRYQAKIFVDLWR